MHVLLPTTATLLLLAISCAPAPTTSAAEATATTPTKPVSAPADEADAATPSPEQQDEVAQDEPAVDQATLEAWTEEILAEVEELRKRKFPRPVDVAVSDEETLREYIVERQEKSESPEDRAAGETVAKLMGVLPPELDLEAHVMNILEGQVGGFYDPETEGFYLMESFGGGLARHILAHELTHALDDQLFDLDGTFASLEGNSDALWAFQALVEGSGTQIGGEWTAEYGNLSMEEQMQAASMGMEELATAQPYVYKPLLGAYLRGQLFLCRATSLMELAMKAPKPAPDDYDLLFGAPPRSSEQVLHPKKYWDEDERDEPIAMTIDASGLPDGWSVAREDTLGELGLALFVEPPKDRKGIENAFAVIAVKYTYPAAEGWGGDRYVLLANGDARLLHVATAWDTAEDAREFKDELTKLLPHVFASVGTLAEQRGVEGSGFAFADAPWENGVTLTSWIGLDDAGAEALVASLAAARAD